MTDTFECYRRFLCKPEGSTFIVVAEERDYSNGKNTLRNIILKDEMPCGHTLDRGWWEAQGIANEMGRHVFLYLEHSLGSSCGPVFPIDNEPSDYMEEERGEEDWYDDKEDKPAYRPIDRSYSDYIGEMQKEGRWQGDRNHPKYPWKTERS